MRCGRLGSNRFRSGPADDHIDAYYARKMPRSLWESFAADRIDHANLQCIIGRHFPSGSQPAKRVVIYPGDEPHAIKLRYAKDDRLTHIEAGPALTPECEAAITSAIADALTPMEPRVFRHVLFAAHKLTGELRYKDTFQVTSVPPEAPQLNCLLGDHPFILESKVTCSKDGFVTARHASQLLREHELLLAGLTNAGVHELPARPWHGYWVLDEEHKTTHRMPGYHYPMSQSAETFTTITTPAPHLPSPEMFGPYSMPAGTPFTIPNDLTETIDAYYALPPTIQRRFLRSCYWLQYAHHAFLHSSSAALMAVVTAAEVLFPPPPNEKCAACGQPQYRLRSAFAQLLEQSLTLLTCHRVGEDRTITTRLKHLYDTRSSITHGTDLRGWDTAPEFTPRSSQDDDDLRTLLRITPHTLARWLRKHATTPQMGSHAVTNKQRRSRQSNR
jgi:hypothetical protein